MSKDLEMLPRTFVFENQDDIYAPIPPTVNKENRYCSCVYVCDQLMNYPVDKWGRRIIPEGKICPYVKTRYGYSRICACDFVHRVLKSGCDITARGKTISRHLYKVIGFKEH